MALPFIVLALAAGVFGYRHHLEHAECMQTTPVAQQTEATQG